MKKPSVGALVLIVLIGISFFSCKGNKTDKMGGLEFDSIKINKTYNLFNDTAKPSCNLVIDYVYPVQSSNPILLDSINLSLISSCLGEQYLGQPAKTAIETFEKNYSTDYRTQLEPLYLEEQKNDPKRENSYSWYSYYKSIQSQVKFYEKNLLVYQLDFNEYTGGAHGMYAVIFKNFNLENGATLQLGDLFKEDTQKELTQLLCNQLMKDNQAKTMSALQDMGYNQNDELAPTENFYINNTGISFFYNVYEIAPYSSGTTTLTLTFESLKPLLKENSPIQNLF